MRALPLLVLLCVVQSALASIQVYRAHGLRVMLVGYALGISLVCLLMLWLH